MKGYNIMCDLYKFLSEEAVGLHKNYLDNLKLEYSILEKSIPEIKNMSFREIWRAKKLIYKEEILRLKVDIECHKLFFSSFGNEYQQSKIIKDLYGSEASFMYEISTEVKKWHNGGFLIIGILNGAVYKYVGYDLTDIFIKSNPILAIDLCEHSYFLDFGFDKVSYFDNALKYLNLSKIDKFLACKD